MKMPTVVLVRLEPDDREQFILDNQEAFLYGATQEFGMRDDHFEENGEIISRKTIENSIDGERAEVYRIIADGEKAGGIVISVDGSRGIGFAAWCEVENCIQRLKCGKPLRLTLKNATFISMSTAVGFILWSFSILTTQTPTTRISYPMERLMVSTECFALIK